MDKQRQDDQLEPTHSSSVPKRDVNLKTCRKQWTIVRNGEWESGKSVLIAGRDGDDDDDFTLKGKIMVTTQESRKKNSAK